MTQHLFRAAERKRKARLLQPRILRRLWWRFRLWQIKNQKPKENNNV
jgi:hypothetical protein